MTDRTSEREETVGGGRKPRSVQYAVLGTVCALVIGVYAWSATSGRVESGNSSAEKACYNLLVQGFRAGQLDLKREVPSELAPRLASPDSAARSPYWFMDQQLLDLSYYRGKLYLYFGVTPALVLFWPYAVLSGRYLLHPDAVVVFFSVGFLAGVGLLWAVWRRYFAEISFGVVLAGTLALGLATFAPAILQRCDVYEVAISCGYALTMVTLLLLWKSMQAKQGRAWWLTGASLSYGLALGARPSLLCGAVILLVPVVGGRQEAEGRGQNSSCFIPPSSFTVWLAAGGPIVLIGLGLLLHNFLRFNDPLEFGQRYQLPAGPRQQFSLDYLWFNIRVCFLEPARWSLRFPFVHGIAVPPLPRGSGGVFDAFGVLTNMPVVWLALAAPLAWRGRLAAARSSVRWFLAAVALLFGAGALTICLHDSMNLRYEVEFASALMLMAVIGIFGWERAMAGQPVWRRAARCGWGLLLGWSVAFNLLAVVEQASESRVSCGVISFEKGQRDEAIVQLQKALRLQPDNAKAHNSFGVILFQQGKTPEAVSRFEQTLRLEPDYAEGHFNLGTALSQQGKVVEAIPHLEQALRFKPDYAEAHNNLGTTLFQQAKVPEAIGHLEQALRLKPDYAEARKNLGVARFQLGENLAAQGNWDAAITQYERAIQMKPDNAQAQDALGMALSQVGRFGEAARMAETALALAKGAGQVELSRQIEGRLRLYRAGRPYHEGSTPAP